ncbi:MAG: tetratricopeptide repeat protein, partial [Blastocatellia bacterium]|nr:tetratricopeptide repeat protein [Blastocatellia bacterium]
MIDDINDFGWYNGRESHPDGDLIIRYTTGCCSAVAAKIIEDHCLNCLVCRAQLSILPRTRSSSLNEENHGKRKRFRIQHPVLAAALIIVILLISGSLLAFFSRPSAEEGRLARLREIYGNTRSLQARVTGGFAHHEYVETRSLDDSTGIDESRRVALLSELDHDVSTHQKAFSRHNLSRLFMLHGDLDAAEQQLLLALKESPRDAGILTDLGALYYERSRKEIKGDIVQLHKAAEQLVIAVEADPKLPEAWFNRALCYERMNLFLQAESDWKQYLKLDSNSAWAEEAHEHLNGLHDRATRLEKQEQNAQAEFRAAEAAGDETRMRELVTADFVPVRNLALNQLFDKYLSAAIAGEKNEADRSLRSLKNIGRLIGEIKGDRFVADAVEFAAHGSLAVKKDVQSIHQTIQQAAQEHARGNAGAACDLWAKARDAAERIGDHSHAELAALGLARYYHNKDESNGFDKIRNDLVNDSKRRSHLQIHAKALLTLANVEGGEQRLSLCLEHSQQAAEIARELGDAETAINGLRFVGDTYVSLGDRDSAIKWFFQASSLIRELSVLPIMASVTYDEMSDALFREGKYVIALPYELEAVRMCEQSGNPTILAYMIQRLGLTYGMLNRYDEATRYLNDAVARAEALPDKMARLLLQIDLYTNAGDFYLRQKKYDEAIATYRRAIERIGGGNMRFQLSSIHQGLASAYLATGQEAEAEAELKESIKLAEEAREQISDADSRSSFSASRQEIYNAMVSFQFFNKRDQAQAFNYAEIAKARALLDTLAGSTKVSTTDGQVKLTILRGARPLTLDQVQMALPDKTQLIQYVIGEKNLMIWLVGREHLVTA